MQNPILDPENIPLYIPAWRGEAEAEKPYREFMLYGSSGIIQRYPEEELPLVSVSTEQEEELRQLISMKQFQVKTRTALINRLHAVYVVAGETGGHIQQEGCRALRSIVLQSVWSLSRSTGGGRVKEKCKALSGRMS
jgi:hypothetical protein